MKKVIIIDAGFSGLASAITSASLGNDVIVIEKNGISARRSGKSIFH